MHQLNNEICAKSTTGYHIFSGDFQTNGRWARFCVACDLFEAINPVEREFEKTQPTGQDAILSNPISEYKEWDRDKLELEYYRLSIQVAALKIAANRLDEIREAHKRLVSLLEEENS